MRRTERNPDKSTRQTFTPIGLQLVFHGKTHAMVSPEAAENVKIVTEGALKQRITLEMPIRKMTSKD